MSREYPGILKFLKLVLAQLEPRLISEFTAEEVASVFASDDRPSAPAKPRSPLSKQEEFWSAWVKPLNEVMGCLETLDLAADFLGEAKPSTLLCIRTRGEAKWLEYHLHAYIQEETILCYRIHAMLNQLASLAEKNGDSDGTELARSLKAKVDAVSKGSSDTRNSHVHEQKWYDAKVGNFGSMIYLTGMFSELALPQRLVRLSRSVKIAEHSKLRKKWRTELVKNNKAIGSFCDEMCMEIASLLVKYAPPTTPRIKRSPRG